MRRALLVIIVGSFGLLGLGCDPQVPPPDCAGSGSTAHSGLRYAQSPGTAANLQSLDLYLPVRPAACGPAPLVAYVHGGAFINGDKANQITDKRNLFTREGWAFASLNYRLVGDPGAGPTNGVYPAAEQDIAAAIAYLKAHAVQYDLDSRHVMLLGHSAGAFLVALDSTDGTLLESAGLQLDDIVCTAPLDTTYDIAAEVAQGGTGEAMFRNAFGDDPAVWDRASPPHNVAPGKGIPSFHIVTRGTPGRIAQSQSFGASLRNAGIAADVQVVSGLSHEEVNDAVGNSGDTVVTPPLMAFFRGCAKPPSPGVAAR
jgi:arylformamidase